VATLAISNITALNNISTSATQVIGINPARQQIIFHNPGTVDIVVFPTLVLNSSGTNTVLSPTTGALGGGFRVFGNGGMIAIGAPAAQQAWQALSVSGSGNPLTIAEQTQ